MSGAVGTASAQSVADRGGAGGRLFRDRPVIPLIGLLGVLIVARRARPARHRQRRLGGRHRAGRCPAGDPRRLPDADHADRWHRPVGRGGRLDVRLRRRDARSAARAWRGDPRRARRRGPGRARHRRRRRRLPRPPVDHDPGHGPGRPRPGQRLAAGRGPDRRRGAAEFRTLGSGRTLGIMPVQPRSSSCPWPLSSSFGLRRTGYGRMLYAIGDNPIAARLSGARSWQVLVVLYVISALLAASPASSISGLTNVASVTLADAPCCPRSRPRSSAAPRSWAAAAAMAGRSSAR